MLVSTVVPTWNRARVVTRAIDSALAQTHAPHEVIVVDDGSTDATADALESYGERIRVVRQARAGVAQARNEGIARARGEAVAFLDSDDAWRPEKLQLQVALLRDRPEIDLVLTDYEADEEGMPRLRSSRRDALPHDGWVLPYVLRQPSLATSTALVRTTVLRALGGFDPALVTAEDIDLLLRIALRHQVALVDRPLVRYHRSDEGLGSHARSYRDALFVVERFVARHPGEIDARDRRAALFAARLRAARGLVLIGETAAALGLAAKSLPLAHQPGALAALAAFGADAARILARRALRRGRR